jgi:2-polyprenyl-3-methyl-5-hydroxy-6-metoxy-1,4-benzoquinol methylase/Tfp pilus assembly protein PilF
MNGTRKHGPTQDQRLPPDAALEEALDALRAGRLDQAQALARNVADAEPSREDAWRILAEVAQRQGRPADAAQVLKDGISQNAKSSKLFTLLGLLLRDSGHLPDAETALRHARGLDPKSRDAALNLGNILAQQHKLQEAEEVFRAASEDHPTEPRFPLQIGRLLLTRGYAEGAQKELRGAVALSRASLLQNAEGTQDPSLYIEAASLLASSLLSQGNRLAALDYLYDCVLLGGDEKIRGQFAQCVSAIPFADAQPLLKPLLARALAEAWIEPQSLLRQCANQLMLDPDFSASAERIEIVVPDASQALLETPDVAKLARDALLRAMLVTGVIPNASLERVLTKLRQLLLYSRIDPRSAAAQSSDRLVAFAVAIANQCLFTGHAYAVSPDENPIVESLASRINNAAVSGSEIEMADLATLAAYRALCTLESAEALSKRNWPSSLQPLIQRQLREPFVEKELRKAIPRVTPMATSAALAQTFEDAPIRRWAETPVRAQRLTLVDWLRAINPDRSPPETATSDSSAPVDILVVECGTGRRVVSSATRFVNSNVLAIDRSLSNLAYAHRRMQEIGLKNVAFAQGDVLELDGLGRQFDVVECVGALNQLADPLAGWRAISRLTKPGGYIMMGLSSRSGWSDLEAMRTYVAGRGYGVSDQDLRRLRTDVLGLQSDDPVRKFAKDRDEFYALGTLRDMVFQEYGGRFTIADISTALRTLGLEFYGFAIGTDTRLQFAEQFGAAGNINSPRDWDAFEAEHPDTFTAMYNFLVRKPN